MGGWGGWGSDNDGGLWVGVMLLKGNVAREWEQVETALPFISRFTRQHCN